MFVAEMGAGVAAGSKALQADALDFFGDATNYAISLGVAGMALAWRARAAPFKGATLTLFGLYVIAATVLAAYHGSLPAAGVMGLVGIMAPRANAAVAILLLRFRVGHATMRCRWIFSPNTATG